MTAAKRFKRYAGAGWSWSKLSLHLIFFHDLKWAGQPDAGWAVYIFGYPDDSNLCAGLLTKLRLTDNLGFVVSFIG